MKEEFDRKPGLNPAGWKYGSAGTMDHLRRTCTQTFMLNGTHAWYIDGVGLTCRRAATGDRRDLSGELVLNPHGFPEGGSLPARIEAVWRWELGEMGRDGPEARAERMRVVSITWGNTAWTPPSTKRNRFSGFTPGSRARRSAI